MLNRADSEPLSNARRRRGCRRIRHVRRAPIAVAEHTPTLTVEASADTLTAGDVYVLYPTYTDTVGDHNVNALTVDWGDNTTNVYEGGGPGALTHVYAEPGGYTPQLHMDATMDDGSISASAPPVDVERPTLSIAAEGDATANEAGQGAAAFGVSRSGTDVADPFTYFFQLGGSLGGDNTDATGAYITTEEDGRIIDSGEAITMAAGQPGQTLYVTALEDHTPRWTEAVDVTLSASTDGSSEYTLAENESAAGCYVVNDDLYAWLGNGSDNDILTGDGGDYQPGETLTPLVLDLPTEQRDGAVITLTDDAPGNANVWMSQTPGSGDQPVLGMVNGVPVSEATWTLGADSDAPSGKTTLWVEATDGSTDLNAIQFEVHDDDSGCGSSGTDTDPPLPQDPLTQPTTSNAGATNTKAVDSLEIIMVNDPNNSGDRTKDIAGGSHPWLVGQMVWVAAEVIGPDGLPRHASFSWSVDDQSNALRTIVETESKRTTVPLTNDDGGTAYRPDQNPLHTGLMQQDLEFFWYKLGTAPPGPESDTVKVTATRAGVPDLTRSTTFELYSPTSAAWDDHVDPPIVGLGPDDDFDAGLFGAGYPFAEHGTPGIKWTATVSTAQPQGPAEFATGTAGFMQLVTPGSKFFDVHGNVSNGRNFGVQGLDDTFLYNNHSWTTDGGANITENDSPFMPLSSLGQGITGLLESGAFTTYLVYKPRGADSQWVTLQQLNWSFAILAERKAGDPPGLFDPPSNSRPWTSIPDDFSPSTVEPQWNTVIESPFKFTGSQ